MEAMREDYRDELAAAHRRIDGLESALADERTVSASLSQELKALREATPAPGRRASSYFALGVVSTMGAAMVLGIVLAIVTGPTLPPPPTATTPVAVPYLERVQVSYYPQAGAGPLLVDVNGDGVEDIVWLYWDSQHEKTPLHVVATDGADYKTLWSTPGYASQWYSERTHLTLVGRYAVMTDSKESVRALDIATGEVRSTFQFRTDSLNPCAAEGIENAVILGRSGESENHVYDVTKGEELKLAKTPGCAATTPACNPSMPRPTVCSSSRNVEPKTKDVHGFSTLEANDAFVLKAWRAVPDTTSGRQEWAVGGDRKTSTIAWENRVAEDADAEHFGIDSWAMDPSGATFFVGYQLLAGEIKVVARGTNDGALKWARVVPDTTEGSRLHTVVAGKDRVYVVTNQRLHIYKRDTGDLVHEQEWLSIPLEGRAAPPKTLTAAPVNGLCGRVSDLMLCAAILRV
jgi:hypothetical protein